MILRRTLLAGFVIMAPHTYAGEIHPALLNNPPDGSVVPAPEVHAVFRPAEVLGTTIRRQGDRDIIVQRLALDPDNPVSPVLPAAPARPIPSVEQGIDDETAPFHLMMLSATVYPGPRTRLSWVHQTETGTSRECSGWSNIDFNHFTGIATFRGTDGEEHSFIMGIGTESEPSEDAPEFATETPTFIPDGEIPAEALVAVDSMHRIYATDGEKLAFVHARSERVRLAKEAELLANPPQPKDLIIRYRIAVTPLPTPAEGGAQ